MVKKVILFLVPIFCFASLNPYTWNITNKTVGTISARLSSNVYVRYTTEVIVKPGETAPAEVFGFCIDHIVFRGENGPVKDIVTDFEVPFFKNRCQGHSIDVGVTYIKQSASAPVQATFNIVPDWAR